MQQDEWISLREFARRCEVSPWAVSRAVQSGRVSSVRRDESGRCVAVEWNRARAEWIARTDPAQAERRGAAMESQLEAQAAGEQGGDDEIPSLSIALRRKRWAETVLKELEAQKARGEVVEIEEVKRAAYRRYRAIRDRLIGIADRVAPIVAAEHDVAIVHATIRDEIRKVLHELADSALESAAADDRDDERVAT